MELHTPNQIVSFLPARNSSHTAHTLHYTALAEMVKCHDFHNLFLRILFPIKKTSLNNLISAMYFHLRHLGFVFNFTFPVKHLVDFLLQIVFVSLLLLTATAADIKTCGPKDMISIDLAYGSNTSVLNRGSNECSNFCFHTEHIIQVSEGRIDPVALNKYNSYSKSNVLGDPEYQFSFSLLISFAQILNHNTIQNHVNLTQKTGKN